MRRIIFVFLDGVGLGENKPDTNPLARTTYPTLLDLLDGHSPTADTERSSFKRAEFIPTDARLGVLGRPQSATGQTTILTGINAAKRLGEHYGPKPDARIRSILDEASLFQQLAHSGLSAYFCNAYPERYFTAIKRGKRLLSAVPYAATVGGLRLLTHTDLMAGRGLAADFTNASWRDQLGYPDVPVYKPEQGGQQLWTIAQEHHFVFFEHWLTDLLGHRKQIDQAEQVLRQFDGFLAGLIEAANLDETLIIVTSDHGNVEECRHSKHTLNPRSDTAHRRRTTALRQPGRDNCRLRPHCGRFFEVKKHNGRFERLLTRLRFALQWVGRFRPIVEQTSYLFSDTNE
ncbi:alkaline phosphatase family protein [Chloroflexi bacterium TSY]|nr:alkaline phosphatase family protein [Chloroflexi bacterium TSY]